MRNKILIPLGVVLVVGIVMYMLGIRMTKADLNISAAAEPLACIGGVLEDEHCSAGTILPFTNSLLMTLVVDLILVLLIVFGIRNMKLVPTGLQNTIEYVIETFYNFALGLDRKNIAKFFPLPATIFLFFLIANMTALVPGVGSIGYCVTGVHAEAPAEGAAAAEAENPADAHPSPIFAGWPGYCDSGHVVPYLRAPAADLNVTFAFSIIAVVMVEYFGFQALGLGYLSKFFINPFKEGALQTFVGLIELVSEIMRLLAFAFRIFGNIFGGEVILMVMISLFPYILPLPFYGLEVFVAFIQAFIFAVLTLIFFTLAIQGHGGHDTHGSAAEAH